jgi:hypothetical protein
LVYLPDLLRLEFYNLYFVYQRDLDLFSVFNPK